MKFVVFFSALLFSFYFLNAQTVIYVDKDAAQGGNGSNWSSSFKYLNDAISYANNSSEIYQIWVAEGTYYPDESENGLYSNDDETAAFELVRVSHLIGGFSGGETSIDQADPNKYITKISGMIFEEYGINNLGSNNLLIGNNSYGDLLIKNFEFQNSKNSEYFLFENISQQNFFIRFNNCSFVDIQGSKTAFQNQGLYTIYEECSFSNINVNPGSYGKVIQGGSFEKCYFNNITSGSSYLIDGPGVISRCFFFSNSGNLILTRSVSEMINDSVFANNTGEYLLNNSKGNLQFLNNTCSNNVISEISSDYTNLIIGNTLFFRSSPSSRGIIRSSYRTTDYIKCGYKSINNLPVYSAFFGISGYFDYSFYQNGTIINNYRPQSFYAGTNVLVNSFFKAFSDDLDYGYSLNLNVEINDYRYGGADGYSFLPSLPISQHIYIPNPFIDFNDPLGPDGEPFTEDDGLRLDPDSEWASEVINVPTIDADYELTDILGNDRIIGGLIDLGAYEYMPLEDADGDGISDSNDAFPNNANETLDTDGDGLGDNEDSDDDGDGVDDSVEIATGTDPKQYNSALHSFVQTLGGGTFDADDIAESRLAGQSDVTSDPNTFNLFTQAELTSATETGNTQGQNAVTSDPNSFGLFSSDDISTAQSEFRILGQQDVVSDPLSYGLYSPSYTIGLIDASREAGREDVTSDPSAYGLQATSGSGSNSNSSNVPSSLAGLIEVMKSEGFNEDINGNGILDSGEDINGNGILDSQNGYVEAVYYTSETLYSTGDDQNIYSWDPENKLLQGTSANGLVEWRWVYEFVDTQESGIYAYRFKAYDGDVVITDDTVPNDSGYGFFYSADGDLDKNGISDKTEFSYDDGSFLQNDLDIFFSDETSIVSNDFPNSLPEIQSSGSDDSSSATLYSLEEIKDLRPGSTMIEIHNGQATLTMEVEESDDLGVWTNGSATSIQIPIDAEAGKKFFRFKMAE